MFRLGGPDQPADGPALATALANGLAECLEPESSRPTVSVVGDAWPQLERLFVDLTGCRLAAEHSAFGAEVDGETTPGPVFSELAVRGAPVTVGGTEVTLGIAARDAGFAFGPDGDSVVMALDRQAGGEVRLFIDHDELERQVAAGLEKKLAGQGAKLLSSGLELTSVDGQCFDAEVAVTVRMMFKAKLRAKGRLRLGDDLTLVVEEAAVTGDGMAGRTFAGLVRPQLVQLAGKEFALGTLLPRGIALTGVAVNTDGGLGVSARIVPHPESTARGD